MSDDNRKFLDIIMRDAFSEEDVAVILELREMTTSFLGELELEANEDQVNFWSMIFHRPYMKAYWRGVDGESLLLRDNN